MTGGGGLVAARRSLVGISALSSHHCFDMSA